MLTAKGLLPGGPRQWLNCACVPTGYCGVMIALRKKRTITAEETGKDEMIRVLFFIEFLTVCRALSFTFVHLIPATALREIISLHLPFTWQK